MSFITRLFAKSEQRMAIDSPLELVNYAASLASNPREIDPILDQVRAITSNLSPGQVLSAEEEAILFGVYLRLEQYLATKEPLRSFPRAELRKKLTTSLLERLQVFETNGYQTSEKVMVN
jgi:hypothetical protein